MTSADQLNAHGRLSPGKHSFTMHDLEQLFVQQAPMTEARDQIFSAFLAWRSAMTRLLPEHRLWIDGGFVTHKPAAPKDIDVAIIVKADHLNALDPAGQDEFASLLTYVHPATKSRIQPMAGLVDAFYALRSKPDDTSYWFRLWQRVKEDDSATKGFVEVKSDG